MPDQWSTLEAFIAGDLRRGVWAAGGRHEIVGVLPDRATTADHWVVRWIPATGEVYASRVHNPAGRVDRVLLLGTAPTAELLRAALGEGWDRRTDALSVALAHLAAAQPGFARWSAQGLERLLAA